MFYETLRSKLEQTRKKIDVRFCKGGKFPIFDVFKTTLAFKFIRNS